VAKAGWRVGRLTAEGVMVLLGVFGAFLLEGWRDDRELAREVRQELASVEGELRRNRDAVGVEIQSLYRVVAGGDELIRQLESSRAGSLAVVSDTLFFLGTAWHPTFNASLGAVEALLASGRLAEIQDPDLRLGLASLDEIVEDAIEEELFARAISVDVLAPVLDEAVRWPNYQATLSEFFGGTGGDESPQGHAASRSVPTQGTVEIPATLQVRNLIRRRVTWQQAAIGEFRRLERRLGELIGLVEEEIS